jgi:hypothetical protein
LIDVPDGISLNESALLALALGDELREVGHVLLQLDFGDGHELPCHQYFPVFIADT